MEVVAAAAVAAGAARAAEAARVSTEPQGVNAEVRDESQCVNDAIAALSNECRLPPGMRSTYRHHTNSAAVAAAETTFYRACAI